MAKKIKRKHLYIIASLAAIASVLVVLLSLLIFFHNRFYPATYINSFNVEGMTEGEAERLISQTPLPENITIRVLGPQKELEFKIPLEVIHASIDYEKTVKNAFQKNRRLAFKELFRKKFFDYEIDYNNEFLDEQLSLVVLQIPNPPEEPSLIYSPNKITVKQGVPGTLLDPERLKKTILENIERGKWDIEITPETHNPTLSPDQEAAFLSRAQVLSQKTLKLSSPGNEFIYETQELLDFINPNGGFSFNNISPTIADISTIVKTAPVNPVFTFDEGRVKEFSPSKDGLEVKQSELLVSISKALEELEKTDLDSVTVEIPLFRTPPDYKTEDVNNLGIKELIGTGTSFFKGSIASRVHNINLAASRLNGVLIPPGETFSFTKTLGDISVYTGYQQAYVIQGNQTVLGDGGGVCQVSTTFFRASLNAGLPILERHAHSYRVGYYEQGSPPGIDATIYSPSVDIKIKNDTPGHILIQTVIDKNNYSLKFDLYGTSDGRIATVSKPVVSQSVAPPEDLYIDDPTLPTGQVKQIDYKAWGAKVSFNYTVERNGQVIFNETYNSNYRPWQAKFLRGTGPAQ